MQFSDKKTKKRVLAGMNRSFVGDSGPSLIAAFQIALLSFCLKAYHWFQLSGTNEVESSSVALRIQVLSDAGKGRQVLFNYLFLHWHDNFSVWQKPFFSF